MIARITSPSPNSQDQAILGIVQASRRTWTAPDGSVWAECDETPHRSGKPAVCGIPLADYCPRAEGGLPVDDQTAYRYAVRSQGFTGTYQDWLAIDADERAEYESGAAGIPTA